MYTPPHGLSKAYTMDLAHVLALRVESVLRVESESNEHGAWCRTEVTRTLPVTASQSGAKRWEKREKKKTKEDAFHWHHSYQSQEVIIRLFKLIHYFFNFMYIGVLPADMSTEGIRSLKQELQIVLSFHVDAGKSRSYWKSSRGS